MVLQIGNMLFYCDVNNCHAHSNLDGVVRNGKKRSKETLLLFVRNKQ